MPNVNVSYIHMEPRMSGTADRMGYGNRGWNGPPPWQWSPRHAGRAIGVVATVLGFIVWWPIGLALLFSQIWSGRMGCWTYRHGRSDPPSGGGWMPPWAGMCGRLF